jgi:hypothetical protein
MYDKDGSNSTPRRTGLEVDPAGMSRNGNKLCLERRVGVVDRYLIEWPTMALVLH